MIQVLQIARKIKNWFQRENFAGEMQVDEGKVIAVLFILSLAAIFLMSTMRFIDGSESVAEKQIQQLREENSRQVKAEVEALEKLIAEQSRKIQELEAMYVEIESEIYTSVQQREAQYEELRNSTSIDSVDRILKNGHR